MAIRITELEQSLIKSNMEIANVRSQLEIERGLVAKLRKEREEMNLDNESFGLMNGISSEDVVKPTQSTSLFDMFRLKRKSPKQIEVADNKIFTESLDYANYLLEIHEDKLNALESVTKAYGGV